MSISNPAVVGHNIIVLDHTPSTNNFIADHENIHELADGTVVLAHQQTAGRGQRGRFWSSIPGKDLTLSILLRPKFLTISQAFVFNKAISLAIQGAVSEHVVEEAKIKWPNDILVDDQKISGLLIEMVWQNDTCQHAVIGIGLNVLSQLTELPSHATSMKMNGYAEEDIEPVLRSICRHVEKRYAMLSSGLVAEIEKEYQKKLFGLSASRYYAVGDQKLELELVNVDCQGRLLLKGPEGVRAYQHGEARVLI